MQNEKKKKVDTADSFLKILPSRSSLSNISDRTVNRKQQTY